MDALRRWWGSLEPRERYLVGAAILLASLTFAQLLWRGAGRELVDLREDVAADRTALAFAQRLSRAPRAQAGTEPLLAAADRAARGAGLGESLERLSQDDGGRVRVRLEGAPFGAFARWLGEVQRTSGAQVESLLVTRGASPGLVDVTLTFAPGGG